MEIKVYTPELVFLGVVENHEALLWYRKYYEPGNFELWAPATERNISMLQAGNIITKKGSVDAGVIGAYEDEEGSESSQIIRTGEFLGSYTGRRLLKYTNNFSGTYEAAMRYLVQQVTEIPLLELGDECGDETEVTFQVTWKNLQTYLTKLSKASGLGYRIRPDFTEKKLYFEVYSGVDHSTRQSENPRVTFSPEYGNLNDVKYTYDDSGSGTVFYIGGEGEGSDRKIIVLSTGEESGTNLREIFIDAKDLQQDEEMTDEEYEAALLERGYEKAADYQVAESVEAETEDTNFLYKTHWDLGDIVTVKKSEWGIDFDKRITEVQEVYENGGESIVVTYGDPLPETIDLSED